MTIVELAADQAADARTLRSALGRFATGVTIITTVTEGRREGLTANSFAALSLEPPLVLWSLGRAAPSAAGFLAAGRFAINVLGADQAGLSQHFSRPRADKFAGIDIQDGLAGLPLVTNALACFECRTEQVVDGGDHLLFIGRVERLRYRDGEPLIFSAGGYCTTVPLASGASA